MFPASHVQFVEPLASLIAILKAVLRWSFGLTHLKTFFATLIDFEAT